MEEKMIEQQTAKRVEEMVAKRVEEEIAKRKEEIEKEVLFCNKDHCKHDECLLEI